ncbi:MAG: PKD domain-containing protein [Thermoplasmatota archaeon]
MKTIRNIGMSFVIAALLFGVILPTVIAQTTEIITDVEDDVIVISEDVFGENVDENTTFEKTADKPNIDITKLTYIRQDNSRQVTIKLEVNGRGIIEDRNDLEDVDPDSTSFFGSIVTYSISLETSVNSYEIEYVAGNCTLNYEDIIATVLDNELSVTFNVGTENETFSSLTGTTMQFDINSLTDIKYYMDIAPDSAFFVADPGGPYSAQTGASINFSGSYEDPLSLTEGPYSYTWNFDDGTTSTQQNPTHSYQYAGTYEVTLIVEDSSGLKTEEMTVDVTISTGQPSNGNNTNGDTNGDSNNDGSGLLMFIAVIAVIVIIGIIALIFVIRR